MKIKNFKRKRFIAVAVIGIGLLFTRPAEALFGIPDLVFDPETWTEIGLLYQTAMQTYTSVKMEVDQIVFNATHFSAKEFLRSFGTAFFSAYTKNVHGETQAWDETINGQNTNHAGVAWGNSTVTLQDNPYLGSDPTGSPALSNLATIEISDSAATQALTMISNTSAAQQVADQALQNLEDTALDTSDGTNSEVQQLNLISGGTVQNLRYMQHMVGLLKAHLQIQVAELKRQRDQDVNAANFWTDYNQELMTQPTWGNVSGTYQQELP